MRAGMEAFELAQPLALAGLVIGTIGYVLLIRMRRARRVDEEARAHADIRKRTRARFRRLQRRDGA